MLYCVVGCGMVCFGVDEWLVLVDKLICGNWLVCVEFSVVWVWVRWLVVVCMLVLVFIVWVMRLFSIGLVKGCY